MSYNPADVNPTRPGLFQCANGNFRTWNGKAWLYGGSTKLAARQQAILYPSSTVPADKVLPWREI